MLSKVQKNHYENFRNEIFRNDFNWKAKKVLVAHLSTIHFAYLPTVPISGDKYVKFAGYLCRDNLFLIHKKVKK
jgi:hypothetical protein